MNEIKFKLNQDHIVALKKFSNFKFGKDLLIKTDKNKNIILVMCNLRMKDEHHFWLTLEEKSKEDFMFCANKQPVKYSENKVSYFILPVAVPPIADYKVRIFKNDYGTYNLEMTAMNFLYKFAVSYLGKSLQNEQGKK